MTAAATVTWTGTITAVSSLTHGGETRGTITLLRRERIRQPGGDAVYVPLISGNSFRGVLRRIGEDLLREVLGYDGQIPLAAAHALRGGGALARTAAEPLSGQRLRQLRDLVPQLGVFGCAGGGRIIDGCAQIGKVMPHVAECAHLFPLPDGAPAVFGATQVETYVRQDDSATHAFTGLPAAVPLTADGLPDLDRLAGPEPGSRLMMYRIETFPAGTTFSTWLRLTRASAVEASFFTDVLGEFQRAGRLGGRAAIGHGQVSVNLTASPARGWQEPLPDWRPAVSGRRAEAIAALQALT